MSAVFILMVIMHLLIVMYNNMSDYSISFEEQYYQWLSRDFNGKTVLLWVYFKGEQQIYIVLWDSFVPSLHTYIYIYLYICVSEHTQGRKHSYLPHPTLPVLNGWRSSAGLRGGEHATRSLVPFGEKPWIPIGRIEFCLFAKPGRVRV